MELFMRQNGSFPQRLILKTTGKTGLNGTSAGMELSDHIVPITELTNENVRSPGILTKHSLRAYYNSPNLHNHPDMSMMISPTLQRRTVAEE